MWEPAATRGQGEAAQQFLTPLAWRGHSTAVLLPAFQLAALNSLHQGQDTAQAGLPVAGAGEGEGTPTTEAAAQLQVLSTLQALGVQMVDGGVALPLPLLAQHCHGSEPAGESLGTLLLYWILELLIYIYILDIVYVYWIYIGYIDILDMDIWIYWIYIYIWLSHL